MSSPQITPGAKHAVTVLTRAFVVISVAVLAIGAANLFFTSTEVGHLRGVIRVQDAQAREMAGQVAKLQRAVLSSCAFAADVGSLPVTVPPGAKASELGVSIVADSRSQWRQNGCPGHLAPPQPSFVRWAHYFHLDAR